MVLILQVLGLFLVAIAAALPLAHALELPGKRRLDKAAYLAVQPIYYPGFTVGAGVGEGGGMMAIAALLALTPTRSAAFGWIAAALVTLLAAHAAYWVFTHPKVWLRSHNLTGAGARFFAFDPMRRSAPSDDNWTRLRDRWEYSHVVRAVLAAISLLALAIGVAVDTMPTR